MVQIEVVNIRERPMGGVYIGRGTPLGNPFSHLTHSRARVRVASRSLAVAAFAEFAAALLESDAREHMGPSARELWALHADAGTLEHERRTYRAELNRLYRLARSGPLTLVCHCKPLACHGDAIQRLLEAAFARIDGAR